MRIAGREINIRFWVKTSLKVSLLLLLPVYAFVEVDARLPGLEGYGGNYNCMLFTVFALHYSREVFISMRALTTIMAAIGICIPGIYFTRRLAGQARTAPIRESVLASGFATAFVAFYCVHGISLDYSLLSMSTYALAVFVILPVFVREAELIGLARTLADRNGLGVSARLRIGAARVPRRYAIFGIILALAALLTPYFLLVQTFDYTGVYQFQSFSLLSGPEFAYSELVPYWRFRTGIVGIDVMFLIILVLGVRILFAHGILRYWRGLMSRTRVVVIGAIGFIIPAMSYQLMQMNYISDTLVFSAPLPILFLAGLFAIISIKPTYVEDLHVLETVSEEAFVEQKHEDVSPSVDVPLLYALKSRTVLALSRLRRRKGDKDTESEEQSP
jgi:hypothetical protein